MKFKAGNQVKVVNPGHTYDLAFEVVRRYAGIHAKKFISGYIPKKDDKGVVIAIEDHPRGFDILVVIANKHHVFAISIDAIENLQPKKQIAKPLEVKLILDGKKMGEAIQKPSDSLKRITEPSFDWEGFKSGKFAVHCDTEEKAREFLRECDARWIKWSWSGKKASEYCAGATGYCCFHSEGKLEHCPKSFYTDRRLPVIDYTSSKSTVREVKRPARVGEWIRVVDIEDSKFNGTIGIVERKHDDYITIHHDKIVWRKDAERDGETTGFSSKNHTRYVVLENYQPEDKPTANELFRKAKTGDKIKVIKGKYTGEILTVMNVASDYVNVKNHDYFYDKNQEYIVIEEPADKPFKAINEFTDKELIAELKNRLEDK